VWVFPWFLDISTLSKFLGILFSLITFAFGGVLINHIFSTKKADKINKYAVVIVLLSFLFFLYHTLRKFDVIPHYYEWLSR